MEANVFSFAAAQGCAAVVESDFLGGVIASHFHSFKFNEVPRSHLAAALSSH